MNGNGGTLPGVAAVFVFLTGFAVYVWTASPAMGWLDSPEFVAASAGLGVPHSPGHPLPVLLGKLAALIPAGDMVWRINLMSAAATAGAAAALQVAGARLLAGVAKDLSPRTRELSAAAFALGFALSWSVWFQGVRAEVYALMALFVTAILALLAGLPAAAGRIADPRPWRAASFLAGLALATHHFIALTLVVPAAVACLVRRPSGRLVAMASMLLVLGLAAFLYLPVRSARHPELNWGAPHTAERFVWTVSAKAFHKAVGGEEVSTPGEDLAQITMTLVEQAGLPVFLLALLGLYMGVRSRRPYELLLGGVLVLAAGGRVLIGFDPDIPDSHGYILPALAALFLLALSGAGALLRELVRARPAWQRPVQFILVPVLALLPIVQAARFAPAASMAGARASDALARWELDSLPPRTLLLPGYFQTSFRLWASRAVAAERPDVAVLDRSFLTYPGAADEARLAYPELAALIDAPLRAGVPTPVGELTRVAAERPVMVELHVNLEPELDPWLVPAGPFARLLPEPADAGARDRAEAADAVMGAGFLAALPEQIPPGDSRGLRDALLWHYFVRLNLYCRLARRPAAQIIFTHALQLAPEDRTLRDLGTHCGLVAP